MIRLQKFAQLWAKKYYALIIFSNYLLTQFMSAYKSMKSFVSTERFYRHEKSP